MFEPNGKFDKHISSAVGKSNRMVGWILRTFRSRTKEVMLVLLKALVESQAEDECFIWRPTSENSVNLIECIQRRLTKMIDDDYDDDGDEFFLWYG